MIFFEHLLHTRMMLVLSFNNVNNPVKWGLTYLYFRPEEAEPELASGRHTQPSKRELSLFFKNPFVEK